MNDSDDLRGFFNQRDKNYIDKLQAEVNFLNDEILKRLTLITSNENEPDKDINVLTILKEILTSQRQEITWKNEDIKNLEERLYELVLRISDPASNQKTKVQTENFLINQLRNDIEELLKKNDSSQKRIEDLESQVFDLNQLIKELEIENRTIRSGLEHEMISQNLQLTAESEQSYKSQIAELEEENKNLEEKNRMLKAALLMTVDSETKNTSDSPLDLSEDSKVNEKIKGEKKFTIKEGPTSINNPPELDSEKPERKRKCPNCGATSAFILEIDDKENIIYHNPRIYGKKYKCGDCRYEWR